MIKHIDLLKSTGLMDHQIQTLLRELYWQIAEEFGGQ